MGDGGLARDDLAEDGSARTLVLVGKTGNGKSATGNTILGFNKFESKASGTYVTKNCDIGDCKLPNGVKLNVIDTPGLYSASSTTEFTSREIVNCLLLARNGMDAVLLVFSARNRLTDEEQSTLRTLKILFGSKIVNHMIVVFTNGDHFDEGGTLDDYLKDCTEFQEILKECDDRKVLFDNRRSIPESKKKKQVEALLNLVELISEKNNGKPYMADLSLELRDNEASFREKKRKIEAMKGLSSNQEISHLVKELEKSYNKMLKDMEVKVSNQESSRDVNEQLAKAQAAREETEKKMNEKMDASSEEIKKLRKQLEEAKKETASLREQLNNKNCSVL